MINAIIAGVWGVLVALGAAYFASQTDASHAEAEKSQGPVTEIVKLKPLTVPMIGPEAVEGYLLAVINVSLEPSKLAVSQEEAVVIMQDIAFRSFYGIEAVRFRKPRQSDLDEVSRTLVETMNTRFGSEAVKAVLLQEFSFVPNEKARASRN